MRIGIDVGGTFTDVVLIDDQTGEIHYTKTLTTPKSLADGVINGVDKILSISERPIKNLHYMIHGTTIGTNALIEKKGAKTALITTEGFRDVLEIGRVQRPAEALYDFNVDNPQPLIPRYLRLEVRERVGSKGEVVVPLDEESVKRVIEEVRKENVESVAISLLFSFMNPEHEKRIKEICKESISQLFLSLSSEIAPEFREYERTSTTVINAYLQPILQKYIDSLTGKLNDKYGKIDLRLMQASGGAMSAAAGKDNAIHTVNSGPAGGALAGAFIGRLTGHDKLITVDMGGTSFDIGLIAGHIPKVTTDGKFENYPVKIPVIDIDTIGAGGGSIAWVDKGGALNVGPMSAGADPGPACYNLGGKEPTVTDANLVLNRLNPDYFLGGEMKLKKELAEKAIKEKVSEIIGLSIEEAANGIIRLVNANMVKGISVNSIEKGYDLREFALIAFGGAGPLHAVSLAKEIGISKVIIPPYAGNLSALGLLVSDIRHDYVQTLMKTEDEINPADLTKLFREIEQEGINQLKSENVSKKAMEILWSADLRYEGQSYELNVPAKRKEIVSDGDVKSVVIQFHELHKKIYAFGSVDEKVVFVNLRVAAVGKSPEVKLKSGKSDTSIQSAQKKTRKVYFEEVGFVDTMVYEKDLLSAGDTLKGPCLIEETISTIVITPKAEGKIDEFGNIIVSLDSN